MDDEVVTTTPEHPDLTDSERAAALVLAGWALTRSGDLLAWGEQAIRLAVRNLNDVIDAAHLAGIGPEAARELVTSRARLGSLGAHYLEREIRGWGDIYDNGARPLGPWDQMLDLHTRPGPATPGQLHPGWEATVPGALARAGVDLARGEIQWEAAYFRFSDATDFGQHAGLTPDQAAWLVTAHGTALGDISREQVTAEIDDWNTSFALDLAGHLADGAEPPGFWAAAKDARVAKGAGDYEAAAAAWLAARDLLPTGHLLRDGLDSLVYALRAAQATGEYVTHFGTIAHFFAAMTPVPLGVPDPAWTSDTLAAAVREHAARLGGDTPAWRKVRSWSDRDIAGAIQDCRDPGEAIARACLTATFEVAEQRQEQPLADGAFSRPPAPQPPAMDDEAVTVPGGTGVTITKATPELQAGDVILEHGMRVRIERLMRTSHSPGGRCDAWYRSEHEVPPSEVWAAGIARNDGRGEACRVTYAWDGRVLNTAEACEAGVVPAHFLYNEARHTQGPGPGREGQWTVQGNDLATWTVELPGGKADPGWGRSAAPRPVPGLEFTGAPGTPLAARAGRRPTSTAPSPAMPARPRRRQ